MRASISRCVEYILAHFEWQITDDSKESDGERESSDNGENNNKD